MNYDYLTIEYGGEDDGYSVYGHGEYEGSSVLAGHPRRVYLDNFDTLEEAKAEYPTAETEPVYHRRYYRMSDCPPDWFDSSYAGEVWGEDDY